jgi:hypothetical protein
VKIATVVIQLEEGEKVPPNVDQWIYAALCQFARRNGHVAIQKVGNIVTLHLDEG